MVAIGDCALVVDGTTAGAEVCASVRFGATAKTKAQSRSHVLRDRFLRTESKALGGIMRALLQSEGQAGKSIRIGALSAFAR